LEDAHLSWPFSDGGHILELSDELLHISFSSEIRGLEAALVTRWRLTWPPQSSEGCDQRLDSEGWYLRCSMG